MSKNQYVSSDLFQAQDDVIVTIEENFAIVNNTKVEYTIEQEFPLIINVKSSDGLSRSFVVKLDSKGKTIISYSGYVYLMEVFSEKENIFNQILLSGNARKSSSTKIPAPMPGLIKYITIKNGQNIKKGEPLFILEAMKMENSIKSPVSGKIVSINVTEGIAVDKNTVLCIIEPAEVLIK